MEKTVVELFAGVGGFRVGLNNITAIDETGKAIEHKTFDFVWANQWNLQQKRNTLLIVIILDSFLKQKIQM